MKDLFNQAFNVSILLVHELCTLAVADFQERPPLPDDPVTSSTRESQEPMMEGMLNAILGAIGFEGGWIVRIS